MFTDLKYAFRQLAKSPGYTVVVVLTLAFGIAVNSTIFGMINFFFLRPLPVPEADRIVLVLQRSEAFGMPHQISFPDFKDYRERLTTINNLLAYLPMAAHLSAEGKSPERAWFEVATPGAFQALGVQAHLGRMLVPSDGEEAGGAQVVVLSHGCWQERFAADPEIVGKTVVLNGNVFTVVGVSPENFNGFSYYMKMAGFVPTGAITAMSNDGAGMLEWRTATAWRVLGRLAPGRSFKEARAEVAVVADQLTREYPDSHKGTQPVLLFENRARPDPIMSDFLPVLIALFAGLVTLVLLIACANVANLMFARAATRQKELTMRAALGATRGHLIRQLLVESILLAMIAGVVSWFLADWASVLLERFAPKGDIPVVSNATANAWDYTFTLVISLVAGVASGLFPALRASRINLNESINESAGGRVVSTRHRMRNMLVVGQVAFSLVVLIGAALFLRSLDRVQTVDLGFDPDNLLMASFDLNLQSYEPENGLVFNRQLLERIRTLPGVEAAALTTGVPFDYFFSPRDVFPEIPPPQMEGKSMSAGMARVSPGFHEMMELRMLRGRTIAESDTAGKPQVAVVNQALADIAWPREDPIGKRFQLWEGGPWIEVVGLTETAKYMMMAEAPSPFFYLALAQDYDGPVTLMLRTAGPPVARAQDVRNAFAELDPHLPVYNIRAMDDLMGNSIFALMPMRMGATLAGTQGAIGLFLAIMGLYAVVSFGVTQRTREIGIRMALGAEPDDIVKTILQESLRLTIAGLVIGMALAAPLGFGLSKLLYGLSSFDPLVVCGVTAILFATAALACWWPARRATRINPVDALRAE